MCRCKYPKSVIKKGINVTEDERGERCYKVSFNLGKKGSHVLVISRAPKGVEEDSCNSLYKRIVKFMEENKDEFKGIQKLTIVNLFTVYEYSREDLYEECILRGREYIEGNEDILYNDEVIAEEIHDADYIIAAWGEPLEGLDEIYISRVELILKSLRYEMMNNSQKKHILRVGEVSKKGYPKHCLAWSYKDKLENLFE
ncbi:MULTISPECIES: DUF1643 domain-containing protein [Clostridium]|uniref:DUF1643 domain-containing protein n=1 Tax=Clostridium cibarium TaxID=2762247 RepID=A0ABR8PRW6_9CLOT|nr:MULTISPECIES: DUF1643 domain-containing protein [Clostridium]MBD7910898.1 DUF1643 domain-containing protein [Clostridium cibarium]